MNTFFEGFLASNNEFQPDLVFGHDLDSYGVSSDDKTPKETCSSPSSTSSSSSVDQSLKDSDEVIKFISSDHSDEIIKFISDMLMDEEDDLENRPCMLHECLALQATERSLYDALTQSPSSVDSSASIRDKKNRYREDLDFSEERTNKVLANNVPELEPEPLEMYDHVLLCSNSDRLMQTEITMEKETKGGSNKGRPRRKGNKRGVEEKEFVDLRSLLVQCAQAVASFDTRTANELLPRIRQHSSVTGDSMERVAHYFANALEARLAGTGTALYGALNSKRISSAVLLKAYKMFITAIPFKKISNLLANKAIGRLSEGASTLHIIDFGILYGFQWPCLIHRLSERTGGPPTLRFTGIDFPQPGFRPAERVETTGRRLANYCERFGVPFEFNAIAKKWDTIKLEDLKIVKGELLVVNSMDRLHNLADESVTIENPRDAVLSLIRKINPDMFIHGVLNGTYNMPFFATRFRETLFHFSSVFDMFDATVPKEDEDRLLFEKHVFGNEVMNVIACEGNERVERPETYKQWQVRNTRAGLKQVSLDQEVVKYVRSKVKAEYHKDFSVDEDGKWMLQGWKGRVICAVSCWQPAHN